MITPRYQTGATVDTIDNYGGTPLLRLSKTATKQSYDYCNVMPVPVAPYQWRRNVTTQEGANLQPEASAKWGSHSNDIALLCTHLQLPLR